jgi:hypothetical protein
MGASNIYWSILVNSSLKMQPNLIKYILLKMYMETPEVGNYVELKANFAINNIHFVIGKCVLVTVHLT